MRLGAPPGGRSASGRCDLGRQFQVEALSSARPMLEAIGSVFLQGPGQMQRAESAFEVLHGDYGDDRATGFLTGGTPDDDAT